MGKIWLQNQWDLQDENKLHFVDGKIGEKNYPSFKTRLEEIKYNRVRLGHTRLTNKYMPAGEDPPLCEFCDHAITVTIKHIFTKCPLYSEARKRFFGAHHNNLKLILNRNSPKMPEKTIQFLKYENLFSEI